MNNLFRLQSIISIFVLLLISVSFGQKVDLSTSVLIEDFEDGDHLTNLGGYWYTFNDNQDGGKSRVRPYDWKDAFVTNRGHESSGMFSAEVTLEKGTYQWNPYYAFAFNQKKTAEINPKNFAGICYWHKGIGHKFRVDIPEVTDYDNHLVVVPPSLDWTLVVIDFADLNQEGWGKSVALNLDNSVKIVFNCHNGSGYLNLDDIRFVKDITYEKQNNMEIKPAEIPAPVAMKGNVNTPLNSLSQQYLTKGMNLASWAEAKKVTSANPGTWKYNEPIIKLQADQGLQGIRFPIDFDLYLKDKSNVMNGTNKTVEFEPLLWTLLDSMNTWTKRYGLSLTIDYHAYDGDYNRINSKNATWQKATASLWKVIASHFVNEKREDLFFELTNEPGLSLAPGEFIDQADWTLLAQLMIDEIRTVDQTRPIIFGDTKWYSLDELVKNTPFADTNIIYCFHMYDPFLFSHQGASWTSMGNMKNIPFPYSPERWSTEYRDFGIDAAVPDWVKQQAQNYYKEGNKQHIMNRLAKVKNWAFEHQVPLICNEWGALPKSAKPEDLTAYFKTMGEIFTEMDIAWQVWFGIMDNEHKLLPGMADALDLKK